MKVLQILTDDQIQLSPIILKHLKPTKFPFQDLSFRITQIKEIIKLYSFIEELGIEEHSGDWDLSLTIQYQDKLKIRTYRSESGYSNIEIIDNKLHIEDEFFTKIIPIESLISIHLHDQ